MNRKHTTCGNKGCLHRDAPESDPGRGIPLQGRQESLLLMGLRGTGCRTGQKKVLEYEIQQVPTSTCSPEHPGWRTVSMD